MIQYIVTCNFSEKGVRDGIEKEGIFKGISQIVNLRIIFKETFYYNTLMCKYTGF